MSLVYCLVRAFLVSVRIETNWSSVNWASTVSIGRRPINSGMNPKLSKSSGSTCCRTSSPANGCGLEAFLRRRETP